MSEPITISELQKRVEELEKSSAEYIAKTDPLLSCVNPSDEKPHCGVCRVCLFEKVESLEKQLLAMREALVGSLCEMNECQLAFQRHGWLAGKLHDMILEAQQTLNSTTDDLSRKYVKREVLEKQLTHPTIRIEYYEMKTAEEWLHIDQFPCTDSAYANEEFVAWVSAIQIDALEFAAGIIMQMRVEDSKESIARDIQAEIQKLKEGK